LSIGILSFITTIFTVVECHPMPRPKKDIKTVRVTLSASVLPEIDSQVKVLAITNDRSNSWIVEKLILRGLAAYKRDGLLDEPPSAPKVMIWRSCMRWNRGRSRRSGAASKRNGNGYGAHRRRAWLRWMICCEWPNGWRRTPRHCRPTISGQSCKRSACE